MHHYFDKLVKKTRKLSELPKYKHITKFKVQIKIIKNIFKKKNFTFNKKKKLYISF